jgi:hypothetical protein
VGERAAGKAATVVIGAGGRKSRSSAVSSVGGTRDPADSNRYTCKLPMRRRSEERGWGASPTTRELGRGQWRDDRRSNSVARAARAREGVEAWM